MSTARPSQERDSTTEGTSSQSSSAASLTAFASQRQALSFHTPKKAHDRIRASSDSTRGQATYTQEPTPSKPNGTIKILIEGGGKLYDSPPVSSQFRAPDEKKEYLDISAEKLDILNLMIGRWIGKITDFDKALICKVNTVSIEQNIFSLEVKHAGIVIPDETESLLSGNKNAHDHLREHLTSFVNKILEYRKSFKSSEDGKLEINKAVSLYADMIQLKSEILNNREIPYARTLCFFQASKCPKSGALSIFEDITHDFNDFFSRNGVSLAIVSIRELERRGIVREGKSPAVSCCSS